MTDATVSIDEQGLIVAFDEEAETLFGHRAGDVMGRPMAELIIPEALRGMHADGMARFLRTREPFLIGRTVEVMALHADGSVVPVRLTLVVEADDPLRITGTIHLD